MKIIDKLLINGEWVDGEAGTTIDVLNPYDNSLITKIAEAKEAIADAVEQVKDVVEAAQGNLIEGKVTKSKLNACKKSDLIEHASKEFGENFDPKITKSNLVNKIYSLHKAK